jgi:hypothetical protein
LLDDLPAAAVDLLPVTYRTIHSLSASSQPVARLAESRFYRAAGYLCVRFHRPISKFLRLDEASRDGGAPAPREPAGEDAE